MSEQDEVANVADEQGGEETAVSASDGAQGVPAERDPQLDDVVASEEDAIIIKTVEDGDRDISHSPDQEGGLAHVAGSELGEKAAMEETSVLVQQPLSDEGAGDGKEGATSSEQGLRYANPYGTFITGIDVNSEVWYVYLCVPIKMFHYV